MSRHWDEAVFERAQARLAKNPDMMAVRRSSVEHPFGTLKERILGNARLLMHSLAGARAELSIAILAYNFGRVVNILGNSKALAAASTN